MTMMFYLKSSTYTAIYILGKCELRISDKEV